MTAYLPIGILILMAVIFATVNIIGAGILGPKSQGDRKNQTYESGMNPVGTARKRFNIRFYIVAMTFLVFDIEIIFPLPLGRGLHPTGTPEQPSRCCSSAEFCSLS